MTGRFCLDELQDKFSSFVYFEYFLWNRWIFTLVYHLFIHILKWRVVKKTLHFMQIKNMILPTRDQYYRFCLTSLLQTLLISLFFCVGLTRWSSSQRWGLVHKLLFPHSQHLGEIVPYNQNCHQTILMKCPLVKRAVFSPFPLP